MSNNIKIENILDSILLNNDLEPEVKLYKIAKILKENNKICDQLWYAILEFKDKYIYKFDWDQLE